MGNSERPPYSTEDGMSQTIESHLANKTKKLENELKAAKEELNIEREEVTRFHENEVIKK